MKEIEKIKELLAEYDEACTRNNTTLAAPRLIGGIRSVLMTYEDNKRDWIIEYSENQNRYCIDFDVDPSDCDEWEMIAQVHGTYHDACEARNDHAAALMAIS